MNENKLIEKFKRDYYGIIAPISLEVEASIFWISYSVAKKIAKENEILITDKILFYNEWPNTYPIKIGIKNKEIKIVELKDVIEPIQGAKNFKKCFIFWKIT